MTADDRYDQTTEQKDLAFVGYVSLPSWGFRS